MRKRKSTVSFAPRILDDLAVEPSLLEIKRLDAVLGAIIGEMVKCNVRSARVGSVTSSGKAGAHRPDAKRRKKE